MNASTPLGRTALHCAAAQGHGNIVDVLLERGINPFTPTDRFSLIQNHEWKSPLKLLSVEMVTLQYIFHDVSQIVLMGILSINKYLE